MKMQRGDGVYKPVTVYIPIEIHKRALKNGINLSRAGCAGIVSAVKQCERKNTGNPGLSTAQDCPA